MRVPWRVRPSSSDSAPFSAQAAKSLALMPQAGGGSRDIAIRQGEIDVQAIRAIEALNETVSRSNRITAWLTAVLVVLTLVGTGLSVYTLFFR
jgi:hypothetical protein